MITILYISRYWDVRKYQGTSAGIYLRTFEGTKYSTVSSYESTSVLPYNVRKYCTVHVHVLFRKFTFRTNRFCRAIRPRTKLIPKKLEIKELKNRRFKFRSTPESFFRAEESHFLPRGWNFLHFLLVVRNLFCPSMIFELGRTEMPIRMRVGSPSAFCSENAYVI